MKRCPECRRDYYDDTLLYCLDDGSALLEGPASLEPTAMATGLTREPEFAYEPATVILNAHASDDRSQVDTAILQPHVTSGGSDPSESFSRPAGRTAKQLVALGIAVILLGGGFFVYRYFKPAAGEQINSIAVLPFENRSGNGDADYLSDGLTDSLIFRFAQLPNLKVSPTSSVMHYKGVATDVAQIAKDLDVDAVLSGGFRRSATA